MAYLVDREGKTLGPFVRSELAAHVAAGEIAWTDMACDEYAGRWMPLAELLEHEEKEPLTIRNTIGSKRHPFSMIGWGSTLGIAYFFYRVARLMYACARFHPR
jgi:hypothetical protein